MAGVNRRISVLQAAHDVSSRCGAIRAPRGQKLESNCPVGRTESGGADGISIARAVEGGRANAGADGKECRELLASLCRAVAAIAVAVPYLATPVSGRC